MGYYVRVLSTSKECVPLSLLESALKEFNSGAVLEVSVGEAEEWSQIILNHLNGVAISNIERNPVIPESFGEEELLAFSDEIVDCKPDSAVVWLREYFKKVQTIYSFQILKGAHEDNGWDAMELIRQRIFSFAPAICQADDEGFSNEAGAHILWQFSDLSPGSWCMAVLKQGKWLSFEMDLGNESHREAFFSGDVPPGIAVDETSN